MLFSCDDRGSLSFVSKLDIPKQSIQRNISAMERFRNMDKRATTEDRNTTLETLHQNSITYVPQGVTEEGEPVALPPGSCRSSFPFMGEVGKGGKVKPDANRRPALSRTCR